MFCPVCGAESTQGLNYCKRCGATQGAPPPAHQPRPKSMPPLIPLALVSMVGLIGFFGTLIALANSKIADEVLLAVAAFGGATVTGVVGLLIWVSKQQSRNVSFSSEVVTPRRSSIRNSTQPQIDAPPLVVSSVTEHTTRNFEPALPQHIERE